MADDTLNPILNPDCSCPVDTPETPTVCPTPDPVTITIEVLPETCPSCDEIIIAPPPTPADLAPTVTCLDADPAYNYIPAIDDIAGSGNAHYFFELHPACIRPIQDCTFCVEDPTCPEDIGLAYRKGGGNVFEAMASGAVAPLMFWVADSYLDRVDNEIGYVKVAQGDMPNEWLPRDVVKYEYILSPSVHFPGGMKPYLNPVPHLGTVPTVATEEAVTSVLDGGGG